MTNESVEISWAERDDADALAPLLMELYREQAQNPLLSAHCVALDHAKLLLNSATPHKLALAWDFDGRAIGLAAVGVFVSISEPRVTHRIQMELKELYVLPDLRSKGIGQALMQWIEAEAVLAGATRIDWHVKRDNDRGIAFYRKQGAEMVSDRRSMRKDLAVVT